MTSWDIKENGYIGEMEPDHLGLCGKGDQNVTEKEEET